jgi:hypothetical protein
MKEQTVSRDQIEHRRSARSVTVGSIGNPHEVPA